jgi:hypothetical protein
MYLLRRFRNLFLWIHVAAAPIVQDTVVMTPVVSSPGATMNEDEEPIV